MRDLQAQLEKDGVTMPEAERRNKERDLANMSRDLQRHAARVSRRPEPAPQRRAGAPCRSARTRSSSRSPSREKFDLILQDPVVFASTRIDITDKVIKALADK